MSRGNPAGDRHAGMSAALDGHALNTPNAITIVRAVAAIVLAVLALTRASPALLIAAYATYWLGDVLDGLVARLLRQETRFGAVLDIVADRASCSLCIAALLVLRPELAVPCAVFLVQFLVLDCHLSLAFLRWPILSPNYFHLVHRGVYRWNWWPPAKVLNTAALALTALIPAAYWYAVAVATLVLVVKVCSVVVVHRLTRQPLGPPFVEPQLRGPSLVTS
ncbi:CDP-alcohol phosphatidyltransferase family protein [Micromonospora sp. KC213]|uniref:CDP-alcohol phosphatidyltransferase family protein n=1 Tax=Micromonospora sp. KC213 TaxID=2530378 RepID=UPI001FB6CD16|nr:CDP-alcohol phosphatidyltransferase family protein [Micromonospora sp. KC213]